MSDHKAIAEHYLAVWNAPNRAEREVHLARWAVDACYVDPLMQGEGRQGIAAMVEKARSQFPGHIFTLSGTPDGYGDFVRFSWVLAPPNGSAVAFGTDMIRLDGSRKIVEVIGFLDGGPR